MSEGLTKAEIGHRIETLTHKGNVLAGISDAMKEVSTSQKINDLNLDFGRIIGFFTYISGELLDNETELEIMKAYYEEKK